MEIIFTIVLLGLAFGVMCGIGWIIYWVLKTGIKISKHFFNKKYPKYQSLVDDYNSYCYSTMEYHNTHITPILNDIDKYYKEKKYLSMSTRQLREEALEEKKEWLETYNKVHDRMIKELKEKEKKIYDYCVKYNIKSKLKEWE